MKTRVNMETLSQYQRDFLKEAAKEESPAPAGTSSTERVLAWADQLCTGVKGLWRRFQHSPLGILCLERLLPLNDVAKVRNPRPYIFGQPSSQDRKV